ncbi:GNAT family N-acetyltransferase [Paracoccus saliphilus]|uniref:GNAT family N-acetyltransferase n=1 Tax=Paracoccus saliphilus TaxID=405559 RepID=A0AA45W7T8_9RHOB|nr:GNAT family N-acetyltransferase [Paracoccus saliphilus]WCR02778.1 GNAT family N-acetyltransferase [Paracoccus saliphilus]SIT11889.1 Ribosomal protein S18 acetylase RimI [Paracoccus saliphilus]
MHSVEIRSAQIGEIDLLAQLWHDGWQDAHASILPSELARHRTLESFRQRLEEDLTTVRVAGAPGRPTGFSMVRQDELYQLYVSKNARGTGVAKTLLADAENHLAVAGVARAWLACAIGNERAARFYEKQGWCRVGPMISALKTPDGIFELEVWRYEKTVSDLGA